MRLLAGKNLLGIEEAVAWVTPGSFTIHNFPCAEDGKNCRGKAPDGEDNVPAVATQFYQDPSTVHVGELLQARLNVVLPKANVVTDTDSSTATARRLRQVAE